MGCGAGKEAAKVSPDELPLHPERGSDPSVSPSSSTAGPEGKYADGHRKKRKHKRKGRRTMAPWEQELYTQIHDVPAASLKKTKQVPRRIIMLFTEFDLSNGGRITFDELLGGLCKKFPNLPVFSRNELPALFKKYAFQRKDGLEKTLDVDRFNRLCAPHSNAALERRTRTRPPKRPNRAAMHARRPRR